MLPREELKLSFGQYADRGTKAAQGGVRGVGRLSYLRGEAQYTAHGTCSVRSCYHVRGRAAERAVAPPRGHTLSTCQQKDLLALDLAKGAAHGLDGGQARGLTVATFADAVGSGVA